MARQPARGDQRKSTSPEPQCKSASTHKNTHTGIQQAGMPLLTMSKSSSSLSLLSTLKEETLPLPRPRPRPRPPRPPQRPLPPCRGAPTGCAAPAEPCGDGAAWEGPSRPCDCCSAASAAAASASASWMRSAAVMPPAACALPGTAGPTRPAARCRLRGGSAASGGPGIHQAARLPPALLPPPCWPGDRCSGMARAAPAGHGGSGACMVARAHSGMVNQARANGLWQN